MILNTKEKYKNEFRKECLNKSISSLKKNIQFNHPNETVLIEFRILPHLEFLLINIINKMPDNWSHTIVCGNINFDLIKKIVSNICLNIKIIKLNMDNLTIDMYSLLLSSKLFWNSIVGEKVLIHQEDSMIFKSNITDFMQWDYIGAPLNKKNIENPIHGVGNGGFSLRSKSIMLRIIDTVYIKQYMHNIENINNLEIAQLKKYMKQSNLNIPPEDVYFTNIMKEYNIGKIADWDSAYNFSTESICNPNSFGGHCFWISDRQWKKRII